MSRWATAICFLLLLAFTSTPIASAYSPSTPGDIEHIERFDVTLTVNADSSFTVRESIRYDFGSLEKHGIYRDIPIVYETKLGAKQRLRLSVESVADERGSRYSYTVNTEDGRKKIKIGDPNKTLTGIHTYVITYTVRGALGYFDLFDELYWNLTGHEWVVPIESVSVEFALPQAVPWSEWRAACYYGPAGSTLSCGNRDSLGSSRKPDELLQKISIDLEHDLVPGEGVTVAFGFPKGIVRKPTSIEKTLFFLLDNPFTLLPPITFLGMFTLWWKRGRDPKGRGVIIPEYEIPESLHPLEIAGLMDGRVTGKHLPAAIIDLAVRGYIRIEQVTKDRLLFDTTDHVLHRLENAPLERSAESKLVQALFSGQKRVALSTLEHKFYAQIPKLEETTFEALMEKKFFAENPKKVFGLYSLAGILIGVACVFTALALDLGGMNFFSILLSGLLYMVFAFFMPRVTKEGALVKERIRGLREYLAIAEKNRLEFHHAPEKSPVLFEKLLPAAMVLGVSDIWAKEFADLAMEPPEWYSGPASMHFSSTAFATDLKGFSTVAASTLASAPGGSSGSGGGGSSGGGGGGGGGGSW